MKMNLSDSDFIAGSISEKYPVPSLSEEEYLKIPADIRDSVQEHLIEITRKDTGESRKFHVNYYADLILEGFFKSVDETSAYNNKLLILANAKHSLRQLSEFLRPFDDYDFQWQLKKINDTVEYVKEHKEYSTFDEAKVKEPEKDHVQTNTEKLKEILDIHRFFDLPMVKEMRNSADLPSILVNSKLPYKIAMFHLLGFIAYLDSEVFATKSAMYKAIANWLGSTEREVSGNIRVLSSNTNEPKERYTADQYLEKAKRDYNRAK
ncbi:hypothetical protein [Taibaiella soli]|uniref:Uncharacterized protein n=1 Tax=Taibaiella soli TaxID=1649169 RepID=A0A2W2AHD0_9BACT|nr:hypothetical protein [Taibaiella soli]PZF74681.1 hypothetical protein DN068_00340 [Taibaiella soli]